MSQIRGSCGHVKASWDNHATCFSCSRCSFETRCSTCKEWTSAIWTLVAKRRTSMGRKKSTEDKKKRDMGAPGTLETVSPTVEGSSDNRHTGSGASVGKSQSETLSQSEKSLGEKYQTIGKISYLTLFGIRGQLLTDLVAWLLQCLRT